MIGSTFSFRYQFSACDHWQHCETIIKTAKEIREYFYAVLELRFCMERCAFEAWFLSSGRTPPSTNKLKQYKPDDFLEDLFPDQVAANRIADFMNAVLEQAPFSYEKIVAPDMMWFRGTYGRLGSYLHSIEKDVRQDHLEKMKRFVDVTHKDLRVYMPRAGMADLREHAGQIMNDYVSGKIDGPSMKKRLQIANIPINLLNPR